MQILEVLIERKANALNRPFTYVYDGEKKLSVGSRVYVTFSGADLVAYVISVTEEDITLDELCERTGYKISYIKEVLNEEAILNEELTSLAKKLADYYMCPLIAIIQSMLPSSLKPTTSSFRGPKIAYDIYLEVVNDDEEGLTTKQIEVLRRIKNNGLTLKKDIKNAAIVKKLLENNHLNIVKKEKYRLKIDEEKEFEEKVLTPDQKAAVDSILNSSQRVTLLEGITGSGKTEIYLNLAKKYISENKNVIMLVPEISLTPMMVELFIHRFGKKVAILHSDLTNAEKYDEYRRIAKGECSVVVGARSAIFAPITNIGLIVLDEEHVESYKQDVMPFYHARDVAIMRAETYGAKVVLGSATPSLESRARAQKGVYNFIKLEHRINAKGLPRTQIVDLTSTLNYSRKSAIFSLPLITELEKTLSRNEQAILLINHRGYSSSLVCRSCGYIFKCPTCDVALTYHKDINMLKCHHCNYVESASSTCPKCGSSYLGRVGFGTERIEEEVKKLFPAARVARLDSDNKGSRLSLSNLIKSFGNHEYDVLVGTQMVAKGHDFNDVTLVGVVSADIGLTLPSIRSAERTFQLLAQAVGRSGRGDKEGIAIIQTFNPTHYAIRLGASQNYEGFYLEEMKNRQIRQYPPYTYLIKLDISAKNEEKVIEYSHQLYSILSSIEIPNLSVIGPVTPFIPYEENKIHRYIVVKFKTGDKIREYLRNLIRNTSKSSGVDIRIDVDPYDY